jgi:DNA-binding CsgD family transcriptional regulator
MRPPKEDDVVGRLAMLSQRQRQVAALAGKRLSNKVIARTLGVTEGTVNSHLHAVFQKLRVRSRYELFIASGPLKRTGLPVTVGVLPRSRRRKGGAAIRALLPAETDNQS